MVKSRIIKGLVTSLTAVIILGTATVAKAETTNNASLEELNKAYESAVIKRNELNVDEESAKLEEAKEAYDLYTNLKSTDLFAAYQNMIAKAGKITKVYTVSEKSVFGFGDEQASQEYWTVARKFFLSYLNFTFANKENITISGVMDRDGGYEKNAGVNIGAYKHYVSVKYTENGETVERFFNYHAINADGNIAFFEKYWNEASNGIVAHWTEEVFATCDVFKTSEEELAANVENAQAAYDAKLATINAVDAEIAKLDLEIKEAEAEELRLAEEARIAEEARLAEEAKLTESKLVEKAKAKGIVVETVEDEEVPVELAPMFADNTVVANVEDEEVVQAAVVETVNEEVLPEAITVADTADVLNDIETLSDEMVPEAASEAAHSFLWIVFIALLIAGTLLVTKAKEKLA